MGAIVKQPPRQEAVIRQKTAAFIHTMPHYQNENCCVTSKDTFSLDFDVGLIHFNSFLRPPFELLYNSYESCKRALI